MKLGLYLGMKKTRRVPPVLGGGSGDDSTPPVFNPEAGLTLFESYERGATFNAYSSTIRSQPFVFAATLDFTPGAVGAIFEMGGIAMGCIAGVDTSGRLILRYGEGYRAAPTAGTTSFIVTADNKPSGAGVLVCAFDFVPNAGGGIRAWWNGALLTGTLAANNIKTQWAGSDAGGAFAINGVSVIGGVDGDWTGGATELRVYTNQTVPT